MIEDLRAAIHVVGNTVTGACVLIRLIDGMYALGVIVNLKPIAGAVECVLHIRTLKIDS